MTKELHHGRTHVRFLRLKAALEGRRKESEPEVGLKNQTPSEWAEQNLDFIPENKQKEVLDHTGKRLILNCARQWGKTTVVAIKALYEAIHQPKTNILVLASSEKQAGVLIEKAQVHAARLGYPKKRYQGRKHSLELPNGSKIFAVAHNRSAALGYTADIVIVDEAAIVKDEVFAAILPSLTRTNGKLWMLSTPSGQTGIFYEIWHDQTQKRAGRAGTAPTGEQLAHQAGPERVRCARIPQEEWRRVTATIDDAPYADKTVVAMQMKIFPARAKQDYYCEFVQPAGRLLTREQIEAMIDDSIEPVHFEEPRWN